MKTTVYIALGSNIGDRAAHIHSGLDAMAPYLAVEESSHLYETDPMLVTDQPLFLNAVCKGSTRLTPSELLRAVKQTEDALGRKKSIRYGPRSIDLDILFYGNATVNQPDLTIPHLGITERDFVLAPMVDLAPELLHPGLGAPVRELWQRLDAPVPPRVLPVGGKLWHWGRAARVMGILNMTPDSFSGDGLAGASDPVAVAVEKAREMVAAGADMLDVGGYSTRPGHDDVTIEEEINRVTAVISALRAEVDVPVSIDTFRVPVAEAALEAGACWLNDVSGLRASRENRGNRESRESNEEVAGAPPDAISRSSPQAAGGMAELAARRRVPLALMDNRAPLHVDGEDGTIPPALAPEEMVEEVCRELTAALALARRAGVARWHRIIDPGIGFGKTVSQHAALIGGLDGLQRLDYPLLFGCSRKGFLGKMAGGATVEDRLAATIAANALAVERGARIVRVHDVRENVQALRVVDAILGGQSQSDRKRKRE